MRIALVVSCFVMAFGHKVPRVSFPDNFDRVDAAVVPTDEKEGPTLEEQEVLHALRNLPLGYRMPVPIEEEDNTYIVEHPNIVNRFAYQNRRIEGDSRVVRHVHVVEESNESKEINDRSVIHNHINSASLGAYNALLPMSARLALLAAAFAAGGYPMPRELVWSLLSGAGVWVVNAAGSVAWWVCGKVMGQVSSLAWRTIFSR